MRYHCIFIFVFLTVTCLALVALGSPVVPVPDPSQVQWTRLSYKASKLFLSATSDVRLESLSATAAGQDLIATPGHRELAPPSSTALLVLNSSFVGRSSSSQVWFDPRRGNALQRLRLRDGKDPYQKTYRFTHGGTYAERRSPNEGELGRKPQAWSRVHGQFYPHPVEPMDCTAIIEPATLLYLIAATPIPPASSMELCAFADKSFRRVSVRHEGEQALGVDYVVRSAAGEEARRGEVDVERYSVRSLPLAGDDDESFEMLGLEGDLEIFLEPQSRLPVQISGRVPKFGHVDVKLREARLR